MRLPVLHASRLLFSGMPVRYLGSRSVNSATGRVDGSLPLYACSLSGRLPARGAFWDISDRVTQACHLERVTLP
jgi:hypothetical protein